MSSRADQARIVLLAVLLLVFSDAHSQLNFSPPRIVVSDRPMELMLIDCPPSAVAIAATQLEFSSDWPQVAAALPARKPDTPPLPLTISYEPTELVLIDGEVKLETIAGTGLEVPYFGEPSFAELASFDDSSGEAAYKSTSGYYNRSVYWRYPSTLQLRPTKLDWVR